MSDVLVLNSDLSPVTFLPEPSTISWQNAIKAVFIDTVAVVAEYANWEVHSPSLTMRVPSVIMTKQYLHFQRNVAFSKDQIFLRDRYVCQYCHKRFPESKLTMDHVLPQKLGGKTTWDNISTACGPCNFKKGSNHRIVPGVLPRRPSYYELLAVRKEFPLSVPCEQWVDYLDWPSELLFVKDKKVGQTRLAA